jgi:hypothetical protein
MDGILAPPQISCGTPRPLSVFVKVNLRTYLAFTNLSKTQDIVLTNLLNSKHLALPIANHVHHHTKPTIIAARLIQQQK